MNYLDIIELFSRAPVEIEKIDSANKILKAKGMAKVSKMDPRACMQIHWAKVKLNGKRRLVNNNGEVYKVKSMDLYEWMTEVIIKEF
jgi:hypothetical protein